MTQVSVAVVGLGNAGMTLHLPALQGLPGVHVAAVCDLDAGRREEAVRRFGGRAFADFDRLLEETRPEVVIVGTPPTSHAEYCRQAVAAGAHVVCEKPFVTSLAEADEVLAAARAAGRQIALNHEFREMPIFRAIRAELGRPEVGNLVFAQIWQLMDLPPWKEPGWRGQMLKRTLYEAGVHLLDLLMALFGEKPAAVTATVSTCGVRDAQSDAVALVTLEFSRGRLAQIVQNRLCKGETQYVEIRADAEHASLRASFGGRARLSVGLHRGVRPHFRVDFGLSGIAWREVGTRRRFLARNPREPGMRATRSLLARTLEAFASGESPPVPGTLARDVLEVTAACYHAADIGTRVPLDGSAAGTLSTLELAADRGA